MPRRPARAPLTVAPRPLAPSADGSGSVQRLDALDVLEGGSGRLLGHLLPARRDLRRGRGPRPDGGGLLGRIGGFVVSDPLVASAEHRRGDGQQGGSTRSGRHGIPPGTGWVLIGSSKANPAAWRR